MALSPEMVEHIVHMNEHNSGCLFIVSEEGELCTQTAHIEKLILGENAWNDPSGSPAILTFLCSEHCSILGLEEMLVTPETEPDGHDDDDDRI